MTAALWPPLHTENYGNIAIEVPSNMLWPELSFYALK